MFAYVARQAIFDSTSNVQAYELLFRDGKSNCFPDIEPDEATSKLIAGSHLSLGVEEITNGKTAFINFHNDTLLYRLKTLELEDYGKITINIVNTNQDYLIIDLLSGKENDVIVERKYIKNTETLVFDLLEPKTYRIRAIIDANKNNKWDTGNYLTKKQPEQVIYFEEELKVRANYYLEGNTFTIKN